APDELAVDVELRNRRPVRVVLDALADLGILEHVDREVIGDAGTLQDLDHGRRESALRKLRGALHVKHDAVRFDLVADRVLDAHRLLRGKCPGSSLPHRSTLAPTFFYSLTAPVKPET